MNRMYVVRLGSRAALVIAAILILSPAATLPAGLAQQAPANEPPAAANRDVTDGLGSDDFDAGDVAAASTLMESLHLADWMGPLAPIALSPFFGLACLSGLAIWGQGWLPDNPLLAPDGPLNNVPVFVVFLVLTVLTSVPRMTKVSKPIAQAVDQLETYSVIIILLIIKLLDSFGGPPAEAPVAMIQLGVFSFTAETLLIVAMVVNLVVINSVRFFFEVLIWLTPLPAIDAVFEIANKTICAAMMAVYAFSPIAATVLNLLMLVAALVVFQWAGRRLTFFRTLFLDPVLAFLWKPYRQITGPSLVVFPTASVDPFVARSRLRLSRHGDGWVAARHGLLGIKRETVQFDAAPVVRRGWISHTLQGGTINGEAIEFQFSRRFDANLDECVRLCGFELAEDQRSQHFGDIEAARVEFD